MSTIVKQHKHKGFFMKKNYILILVLVSFFAQNILGMNSENNGQDDEQNSDVISNNIVVSQTFSFKGMISSTVNSISTGLTLGWNYAKKQSDPIQYSTGDDNIKLMKFMKSKFDGAETIEDLQKLYNYKSDENDDLVVKGNLFKKAGDRNTAFTNVMFNTLIKLTDGTYGQFKQLEREQFNTTLHYYKKLQKEVYEPTVNSIYKAISLASENGTKVLVSDLSNLEIKENKSSEINDKEDK